MGFNSGFKGLISVTGMKFLQTGTEQFHPLTGFIATALFYFYLGLRYWSNIFVTFTLAGGGLSDSRSGCFAPGKTALGIHRVRD